MCGADGCGPAGRVAAGCGRRGLISGWDGDGPGADCLCAAGPGAHDLVVLVTNGVAGRRVEGVILHKMILMIVVLLDGVLIL